MAGTTIAQSVLTELQRQMNHELFAAHGYLALSLWCEEQNFKGFARFFLKQADEERAHARKFIDHLLDRQVLPELTELASPKGKFKSLMDVAKQALTMEQANTAGINAAYEAAGKAKDYPSMVLLQWFITEQVEEEDWANEMVERVEQANCAGALSDLDRHIERYLAEKVVATEGDD
jgi:ferritin